ncbi:MAG: P-loop NTPase [Peptococcaceae bacterium]|nr:P-loop NTPase [Peptococcaceae bacterium]
MSKFTCEDADNWQVFAVAHPGWLANKMITVEVPQRGTFRSRILGLQKETLIITVPVTEGRSAWLPAGTAVRVMLEDDASGKREGSAWFAGQIRERRLKPIPRLVVALQQDIPLTHALTERPYKIIAVTSGKGGTGKTFFACNLALALHQQNLKVGLLDGDLGTANLALVLGLRPSFDLGSVLDGGKELSDIGVQYNRGIVLFPGIAAGGRNVNLSPWQYGRLVTGLGELEQRFDKIIIDTGAGLTPATTNFLLAADFIVLVTNDTPPAILDAYGLLKSLTVQFWIPEVGLVINRTKSEAAARDTAQRFIQASRRFLNVKVSYLGHIYEDEAEEKSLQAGKPLLAASPRARAAGDLQKITERLCDRLHKAAAVHRIRRR